MSTVDFEVLPSSKKSLPRLEPSPAELRFQSQTKYLSPEPSIHSPCVQSCVYRVRFVEYRDLVTRREPLDHSPVLTRESSTGHPEGFTANCHTYTGDGSLLPERILRRSTDT